MLRIMNRAILNRKNSSVENYSFFFSVHQEFFLKGINFTAINK